MEQTAERIRFDFLPGMPIVVEPKATHMSSDAGMITKRGERFWSNNDFTPGCSEVAAHDPRQRPGKLGCLRRQDPGNPQGFQPRTCRRQGTREHHRR